LKAGVAWAWSPGIGLGRSEVGGSMEPIVEQDIILAELRPQAIEVKFDVKASAPMAMAAMPAAGGGAAAVEEKTEFKVAWSIYVGWMPWGYAADTGIVKKWADKYGISIEVA